MREKSYQVLVQYTGGLDRQALRAARTLVAESGEKVRVVTAECPDGVMVVVDHLGTWRRKRAVCSSRTEAERMAERLVECLERDLQEVRLGDMPPWFGVFTPKEERNV
jgi:hypothetical protein